jgi:hypothetical protein
MAKVTIDFDAQRAAMVESGADEKTLKSFDAFAQQMIAATFNDKAAEVIANKCPELSDDDVSAKVSDFFALAAWLSENVAGDLTGGQGGGSKYTRHLIGFDTPSGHLQIRCDEK